MELSQELNTQRESEYSIALNGTNIFEVSTDKFITISGGTERLWSLQTAYDSLFIDPDIPEVDGNVKEEDGTLINCTLAEWDELLKLMRASGKAFFNKNETLYAQINALVETDSFDSIWETTWDNM